MLENILTNQLFAFLLIFTRVGGAVMLMPGIGETYVVPRIRLFLAILIAMVLHPLLYKSMPAEPASTAVFATLILNEAMIGFFLGTMMRMLMLAIDFAGNAMSYHMSLANATIFNPSMQNQGAIISVFLTLAAVTIIFATNTHHLMLAGVVDSYNIFPAGQLPIIGDFADSIARLVQKSFAIGLQLAAPFIVVVMIFYIGLGLLSRLMPQLQIFFIAMPLQILLGLGLLAVTASAVMLWFITYFENQIETILDIG